MERLILRTAGVCSRRPWWTVAVWIVLLAAALPFSGKAQGVLSSGGFDVPGSQSQQAIDYLNSQPGRGAYSFSFLVDAPTAAAAQARAAQVRATVRAAVPRRSSFAHGRRRPRRTAAPISFDRLRPGRPEPLAHDLAAT